MTALGRRHVLGMTAAGLGALATGCTGSVAPPVSTATSTAPPTSLLPSPGPAKVRWSDLRRHLTGNLYLPGRPGYQVARLLQNPAHDQQRPLAVVRVAGAPDVSTTLAFARDHGLPVAVRSGGHSYPGWSGGGTPPAVVIDLRGLDRIAWSGTEVRAGAGVALAPLYAAAAARGRALAAGSCATVGASGLTLGGGVGVLTRSLGLTCDQLSAAEVVTADGRVHQVDADREPDLFWALRGGGGHTGVVTALSFVTSAAPEVHSFYRAWPLTAAAAVVEAWQGWAPPADPRLWSTLKLLGGDARPDGPVVLVAGTWTGPGDQLPGQLAGFLDHLPPASGLSDHSRPYGAAMASYAGCADLPVERCTTAPGGGLEREAFAATSHVAHRPLSEAGIQALIDQVRVGSDAGLREAGVSLDALGGRVRDVDDTATAFGHRRALATVQYTATWPTDGAGDASARSGHRATRRVRDFRAAMLPFWDNHAYLNYADDAVAHPGAAYFGDNLIRLRQVARQHDPDGVFASPALG